MIIKLIKMENTNYEDVPELSYPLLLEETYVKLLEFNDQLHEQMINLIMYGELSEWSESVSELGEVFTLGDDLIESVDDINVKHLYSIYNTINDRLETIVNLNPHLKKKFEEDDAEEEF